MLGSLFGSVKKQEAALRSSLSGDKFADELAKTLELFQIEPVLRSGKSTTYCDVEAAARFLLKECLKIALRKGAVKTEKDLEAVATFSVVLISLLGRTGGLNEKECRELQGSVPGYVMPRVAQSVLGAKAVQSIGKIVSHGVLRHGKLSGKKRFQLSARNVEENITQFVLQRKSAYLDTLARNIDDFR